MAFLGTPYRVVYWAKNAATGLTGITAFFVKPDNTTIGVFPLAEFAPASMKGAYYFDLSTTESDPEGEWIGVIVSPSEGPHKCFKRISFAKNRDIAILSTVNEIKAGGLGTDLSGTVEDAGGFSATINDTERLSGTMRDADDLAGEVPPDAGVTGEVGDGAISGAVKC